MPATKKIGREEIIKSAYEILRKNGIEAVNARSIAGKLGCSTQPIYHAFRGMNELKAELVKAAEERHTSEVRKYMSKSNYKPYMAYGLGFVFLAKDEKQLFRYLFMTHLGELRKPYTAANLPEVLDTVCEEYGYDRDTAEKMHSDMTVFSYGLALGMNSGLLNLTEEETAARFTREFIALTSIYGKPQINNNSEK